MNYSLRFNGAVGSRVGKLPGYPASKGYVRLHVPDAKAFYEHAITDRYDRDGCPLNRADFPKLPCSFQR
jgi:hypothetical protein